LELILNSAATNKPDPSIRLNQLGRVTTYSTAPALPAPPP